MTAAGWAVTGAAIWLVSLAALSVPDAIAAALAGPVAAATAALGRRALAGRARPGPETRPGPEVERGVEVRPGPEVRPETPVQPEPLAGRPAFPWRQLLGLPGAIVTDTVRVLVRAAGGRPEGELRFVDLGTDGTDPGTGDGLDRTLVGAAMMLGLTPGTYVTGIDRTTGRVTVHALVPPSAAERALSRAGGINGGKDAGAVSGFGVCACVLLGGGVGPALALAARGDAPRRMVGLKLGGAVVTLLLVLLASS